MLVGDVMTGSDQMVACEPSTSIEEALELLVDNRVTGLAVVDAANRVVGVISDYDVLALDTIRNKRDQGLFPAVGDTRETFREVQVLLDRTAANTVGDIMTAHPMCVGADTKLEDAARLLLLERYRRLPVVDERGHLKGMITRGNLVKTALDLHKKQRLSDPTAADAGVAESS